MTASEPPKAPEPPKATKATTPPDVQLSFASSRGTKDAPGADGASVEGLYAAFGHFLTASSRVASGMLASVFFCASEKSGR